MLMPMMHIGIVRMSMFDRVVCMGVGVGFPPIPGKAVRMLMVRIVDMGVLMVLGGVAMKMSVVFGEVQPYSRRYQESGDHQSRCQWRSQGHRQSGADKRRQGKVSPGPRGAEIAQREYE